MDEIEMQKMFFFPICNREEIERIFNLKNGNDYLLKLRAETIVDHMRLFRVYRNKALADEKNWSLERSFDVSHFSNYLSHLPETLRQKCQQLTAGNVFSNDANGSIFKTDFGPTVTISDALRFFLKFSHLALLDFGTKVPVRVRRNALRIATRVMLKTEALDFYMDPRGIVPNKIHDAMHAPIGLQLEFIAGHEFAHYLLGHISDSNVMTKPIYFAISPKDQDYGSTRIYNQSQNEEFDADVQAILQTNYSPQKRIEMLNAALLWFGCLDLYEAVCDVAFPKSPGSYQSHPSARARFENLMAKIPTASKPNPAFYKQYLKTVDEIKKWLVEDVSTNFEMYEFYGSVYLDKPNTAWRGRELVDRVDYY